MRTVLTLLPLLCAAMLVAIVPTATAGVDWTHELTDAADDVKNRVTNVTVTDQGGIDILSASVAEQGDDINVTLTLADRYNPDATYQVDIVCDGDDAKLYSFILSTGFFTVSGYDMSEELPEAYVSGDGTRLSWVIAKSRISASVGVVVDFVETHYLEGISIYSDTVPDDGNGGGGGGGGGGGEPVHKTVTVEVVKVTHVRKIVQVVVDGEEARSLRSEFDADMDGTVSKDEYDQHIDLIRMEFAAWNDTDMTLDGQEADSTVMALSFEGVIGLASSTGPVTRVVVLDIHFPEVASASTHTYTNDLAGGGNAGDMWWVTADSQYSMKLAKGWRFETSGWPSGLQTYRGSDGRTLTIPGNEMRSSWNTTMGAITSITIVESAGDGDDGEGKTPGFGAVVGAGALVASFAIASRRRRR